MHFQLDRATEVLARTPATLRALLHGVSDSWALRNYGDKTFSPFDVIGHLIHADRTDWLVRARCILDHGESRPFPPFDRYAMFATSRGKTINDLLDEFTTVRATALDELASLRLTTDQLALRGTHPEFGPVTLAQLLATWVVHDLNHTHQVAKAMACQYRDAVGPWHAYLTILKS